MNIYVGNLSESVSEQQLRSLFEQYGKVASVKVIMDRETGRPRGFAFIEMTSAEEAQSAIAALDSYELSGKNLKVNESRPREGGNFRPRSGGRDFGNRSGGGNDFGSRSRGPRNRY